MFGHSSHGQGSVATHLLRHLMKNKQEIGLTDEQIAKLRAMALDSDKARIRAEADMKVSARELRSLMWDDKSELPAIEAKIKEKASLKANVRILDVRAKRELIAALTPEQQSKLKALWREHGSERRHAMRAEYGEPDAGVRDSEGQAALSDSGSETGEFSAS